MKSPSKNRSAAARDTERSSGPQCLPAAACQQPPPRRLSTTVECGEVAPCRWRPRDQGADNHLIKQVGDHLTNLAGTSSWDRDGLEAERRSVCNDDVYSFDVPVDVAVVYIRKMELIGEVAL